MLRERRLSVLGVGVSVLSLSLWGIGLGLPMVSQAATGDTTTYYLHGTSSDDANRLSGAPSSTFDGTAPTGTTDATQSSAPGAIPPPEWVGTAVPQGIYARSFTLTTYWSTVNPEDLIIGLDLDFKVYTGATVTKDGVTDGTLIAQTDPAHPVNLADVGPNPVAANVTLDCLGFDTSGGCVAPAGGFVGTNLVVVAAPHYTDDGTAAQVHYNSTSAPSKFTVTEGTPPADGGGPGSPSCEGDFCMSAPLVLPKSGQTGGLTDTCYNPCGEPSMAVSPAADGTIYVSTPRTLVACCNTQASPVWKSTDNGRTWSKPIFPTGAENATTGGDTELAVDKRGQVYEGELWLGSDSIYIGGPNGDTENWDWSPASHDLVADREWFVYSPIEDALYGYYDGIKGLMVVKAPLNTPLGSHSGQFFTQERIAVPLWLDCPGVVAGPCVEKPKQVPDEVNGTPVLNGAISPGRPSVSPVDGTLYFPFPYQVAGKGIGLAKTTDGLNFTYA